MIVDKRNAEIICTAHAGGKTHDFKLYKQSVGTAVTDKIKIEGDSGYQGILKLHQNSETPKKKPRNDKLTPKEKATNKLLSSRRMLVENIIAKVKVFKIMANKYRNRRRRFALRMSLICAVINFENKLLN